METMPAYSLIFIRKKFYAEFQVNGQSRNYRFAPRAPHKGFGCCMHRRFAFGLRGYNGGVLRNVSSENPVQRGNGGARKNGKKFQAAAEKDNFKRRREARVQRKHLSRIPRGEGFARVSLEALRGDNRDKGESR